MKSFTCLEFEWPSVKSFSELKLVLDGKREGGTLRDRRRICGRRRGQSRRRLDNLAPIWHRRRELVRCFDPGSAISTNVKQKKLLPAHLLGFSSL
jgi:hypothetical protein